MKKRIVAACIGGILVLFAGCGGDKPFEYRYNSANSVDISYKGRLYRLNRFGPRVSTPFEYQFESDGDLDITIAGKTYDIDSPYDIDSSKKAKKKSTRKSTKGKRK